MRRKLNDGELAIFKKTIKRLKKSNGLHGKRKKKYRLIKIYTLAYMNKFGTVRAVDG